MVLTRAQTDLMRKVAFQVGFLRYCFENDLDIDLGAAQEALQKRAFLGEDTAEMLGLAAIPAIASFGVGRLAGNVAGSAYGAATTPSPATVDERQYQLAGAHTDRLIAKLQDQIRNRKLRRVLGDEKPEATTALRY